MKTIHEEKPDHAIQNVGQEMNHSRFNPGFRLSALDLMILCCGIAGTFYFGAQVGWLGLIIGFVVLHFFLFCNVFRIARFPELIWAGVFITLCGSTIVTGLPGWIATIVTSMGVSSFLIWKETKKADYHGIFWKRWNPDLPAWWQANQKG